MSMKLLEYNEKRDFSATAEPEGREEASGEELKFVVHHHLARSDHYDLRLEWNGVLLSWAVPKGPSFNVRDKRLAVRVEDHPLEYRNFEGTIPKGEYGGGTVMIWDEGFWEPLGNVEDGLSEGSLKFTLKGRRLKGNWALVRMKAKEGEAHNNWLLIKEKDEFAREDDGIGGFNTSVRTGRTMEEIEQGQNDKFAKNPFDRANVQLAKLVSSIPEGDDWLFELKYDGYRIMAFVEGGSVRLVTRNGLDFTSRFWPVASSLLDLAAGRAMVLDGEMVVTDESGKSDFQAIQNYMENPKPHRLVYVVFDLLALDGVDIRNRPLIKRKDTLLSLMRNAPGNLHYSQHVMGRGEESFRAACELGMEGIVGKKANSIYSGTRNGDWIKLKCDKRQELVIGGYTLSEKKGSGISSLLLGAYDGDELVYVGRAGTGFSEAVVKELLNKFSGIERPVPPFKSAPPARAGEKITWLEPELVAEIKFAEWTKDNLLRQASYKGLRTDKEPKSVKMELTESKVSTGAPEEPETRAEAGGGLIIEGVKITNPDKLIFEEPKITKADVVSYYAAVSERMLPYVRRRILSIVRCPKGVSESCFYKKHPGPGAKGIVTIPVADKDGNSEEYFYIEDKAGLVFEAQMGTLEFHTWGSSVDELEKPDMIVFDLDPDEGMGLDMVRRGVRDLRDVLTELSLNSYLKTSGGKGYHVVVPLRPAASWNTVHDFARRVAELMEQKWPERYTSNVRKISRKNKIFIDWIRNGRGATSIAPYSIRARKGAAVSMPITWDELDSVAPNGINMQEALRRIKQPDPWQGFFENEQQLR